MFITMSIRINYIPQIHILASRLGLKRASRGVEENGTRFITVYKSHVRATNKPDNVFTRSKYSNFVILVLKSI